MTSESIRAVFEHCVPSHIPRGELWIMSQIFIDRQVEDDVDSHIALCREMGMDFVSVPVGEFQKYDSGYRLFSPSDIRKAVETDLYVMAVLSGPFQRIVDKKGLHHTLADLAGDIVEMGMAIVAEADGVRSLIEECIKQGANAIVIAEDLAYAMGTFFPPAAFREIIQPHYVRFVDAIRNNGSYAVFHSCGNITKLVPDIVSSGFDGLSCEQACVDLFFIKREYGTRTTLLSGISSDLLEAGPVSVEDKRRFTGLVADLSEGGGLILVSSTGFYTSQMLSNARRLYDLADEAGKQAI
ncbi:MAG: hypothetical protein MUP21_05640 [Dehalococcoidia bacterium]|nr:hypothetical protein [Dehalococcoidia bacterium]